MDWTAKLDQQHDALMRVFYMLVFATLTVIRTGLDVRNVPPALSFTPYDNTPLDNEKLSPMQYDRLDRLYAEAMTLLYAAHAVAQRLATMRRDIFELMNEAYVRAQSLRGDFRRAVQQRALTSKPFDTS